jgi:hypothetical protein
MIKTGVIRVRAHVKSDVERAHKSLDLCARVRALKIGLFCRKSISHGALNGRAQCARAKQGVSPARRSNSLSNPSEA